VPFSTLRVKDRLLGKLYTEYGANGTMQRFAVLILVRKGLCGRGVCLWESGQKQQRGANAGVSPLRR
jgi:hypothetical protein